jgi:membrane protein DedA with SNARE-associated domain
MLQWVQGVMDSLGYAGIVFLMFLENVFPPIPSEVIMPLAGFAAARGDLTFVGVALAGTIGSTLGAIPLYLLGRLVSEKRLERWADKYGTWLTVSSDDVRKAQGWLQSHGPSAVIIGRLVPGVRSLVSIPAGLAEMNFVKFLAFTFVGSALWSTVLAYLGRVLGRNYEEVGHYLGPATIVIVAGMILYTVITIVRRKRATAERDRHASSRAERSGSTAREGANGD